MYDTFKQHVSRPTHLAVRLLTTTQSIPFQSPTSRIQSSAIFQPSIDGFSIWEQIKNSHEKSFHMRYAKLKSIKNWQYQQLKRARKPLFLLSLATQPLWIYGLIRKAGRRRKNRPGPWAKRSGSWVILYWYITVMPVGIMHVKGEISISISWVARRILKSLNFKFKNSIQ